MKTAFTVWQERIAPVFDVTRSVLVVETDGSKILSRREEQLPDSSAIAKITRLTELGVEELVCGAISQPIRVTAEEHGIVVYPFVSGEFSEVLEGWRENQLSKPAFNMPGCGRKKRRRCRRYRA